MTRRDFSTGLAAGLGATAIGAGAAKQPNIVFICSDQHSGRFLGCNGDPIARTPNLDRIAKMGVNFRNTYSGNPVCVPGRACMMSGRYASDVNSFCNSTPLPGKEPTWGNYLRDAGYHCWATGKLDLTFGADIGFEQTKTTHGHSQHPDITSLFRSPVCFRPDERENVNGRFTDRADPDAALARSAIRFIRERGAGKPWAVYVGMHMPHPKWIAEKKYLDIYPPDKMPMPNIPAGYLENRHTMFQVLANFKNMQVPIPEDRIRRARAAYFGMVTEVDEYVGWVLDEVEKSGQIDNTLFIYTSDHGEMLGEHGLWLKNVLLENAAREPLVMAGAGLPKGKTVDTAGSHGVLVANLMQLPGGKTSLHARGLYL